ncbi:MAG TPA: GNAT family N-acetyltransferase [Kineosporiaceae bacterium]
MAFSGASPERHHVLLTDDDEQFASRAAALLDVDPISTNVLATVLAGTRTGCPQPEGSFWVLVEDAAGRPVGAALCTAGFPPFLAAMPDGAAALIAAALHRAGHEVPGVRGDAAATSAFATRWASLTGRTAERTAAEAVHLLGTPVPPVGVPGDARPTTPVDSELAAAWYAAFEVEAHPGEPAPDPDTLRQRTSLFVARSRTGRVLLWVDGGVPVSLAGWQVPAGPAERAIGRVGPVFTPAEHRRRGYAAAVTWAATQAVLGTGAAGVMLYTDLANPTSRGVYARLGYRPVSEAANWTFHTPG